MIPFINSIIFISARPSTSMIATDLDVLRESLVLLDLFLVPLRFLFSFFSNFQLHLHFHIFDFVYECKDIKKFTVQKLMSEEEREK